MRIGMISPYSLSIPGGVQGQILGLAQALRERGEYVRVLGPCDGPPPAPFVTPLGNSIPTGANGSIAPIAPDPAAQLRTIRALRDEDFDIVHLHEPMAPGPTMTAMLLRPAPMIGTFHAAGSSLAYETFRPLVSRGANRLARRFAVSEDAREMAQHALGGEYEIVFNGVHVRSFQEGPHAKTDGPTILFLARHEQRKGLDVLLKAVDLLGPDVRLWIAGEGPDTERLRTLYAADPRLEWLGEVTDDERGARLRGADVFCAPSLHGESFGIVLLEAMAANTAVVASDLAGYSRVARAGVDAALVPPGDVDALAAELSSMLTDTDRRDHFVMSASARVQQFSMRALSQIYLDAYRDVLVNDGH